MNKKTISSGATKVKDTEDSRIDPKAGQFPDGKDLLTQDQVRQMYYSPQGELKAVKNGTSGHRGKVGSGYADQHIAAMTQSLVAIRTEKGTFGPSMPESLKDKELGSVIMGKDVRYASDFAQKTAAEVFAGNNMPVIVQSGDRSTPTPVISHAIHAEISRGNKVEGVVITASHNPPEDGGYKSNGLDGGPNTNTKPIDAKANEYMDNPNLIKRIPYATAVSKGLIVEKDLITPYVEDLVNLVDMDAIAKGGKYAVAPLGGSASGIYELINEIYGTNIYVISPDPDPTCKGRVYDWDGKLRGDPSSKYVMSVVDGKIQELNVPMVNANDNDADRFGGIDSTGILNPNHVLCVLFDYLCENRNFDVAMRIGRTIGTTHMLDKIAAKYGRKYDEVDVGFKWYVEGLMNNRYVLAGEESAGLVFPRKDGSVWVTEKDGIAANLLMMEIQAKTGMDIGTYYAEKLVKEHGVFTYDRIDTPVTQAKKDRLDYLESNPEEVRSLLAGKKITGLNIVRTKIGGGVKVVLKNGVWNLKRLSGTEPIIKDYMEQEGSNLNRAKQASAELDEILGLNIN